jgi:hypothetical protein
MTSSSGKWRPWRHQNLHPIGFTATTATTVTAIILIVCCLLAHGRRRGQSHSSLRGRLVLSNEQPCEVTVAGGAGAGARVATRRGAVTDAPWYQVLTLCHPPTPTSTPTRSSHRRRDTTLARGRPPTNPCPSPHRQHRSGRRGSQRLRLLARQPGRRRHPDLLVGHLLLGHRRAGCGGQVAVSVFLAVGGFQPPCAGEVEGHHHGAFGPGGAVA